MSRLRPESLSMTLLLTALIAIGAMSINMTLPALPAMAEVFGVAGGIVLMTVALFSFGFAVGQLFYGAVSDRFGRRPVLLVGTLLYTATSLACYLAPNIETLIIARLLQGLAAASAQVLARAIVRDIYTPNEAAKVLSLIAAVFTITPAFAPLIGGGLQAWLGWRSIFAVLTGFSTILVLAVFFGLNESLKRLDPEALRPTRLMTNTAALLKNRTFLGYTLVFSAVFAAMFGFHSGSSFVFIKLLGYGPEAYGVLFMTVIGGDLGGTVLSMKITLTIGYQRLVWIGMMICLCASATMLALTLLAPLGVLILIIPQFIFMIGVGLALPNSLAGAMAPFPDKAGSSAALIGFFQQASGGAMVASLGALSTDSAVPMVACVFSGTVIAVLALIVIVPRTPSGA
ncbi:MAG: multidrug effflux MFS transporter [Rhodospirillales bacterium]|nr:multidrug effflux MFS transporter [Rhodospirillales bacterium]